jgi:signal transduction histidine kinase
VDAQFVLPLGVALYTIGSTRSWEAAIAGCGIVIGTGLVYIAAGGPGLRYDDLVATALACAVASGIGLYVGSKRTSMQALEDRAARLDRERELHRTLKLLRAPEDAAERGPQPGLGDLDGLLERSRAAGLQVELAVAGEPRPLPQSVDLSAFRIVQEALTNVLKHAGRAPARVTVDYGAETLELTISDSGLPTAETSPRSAGGHGLIGMRERAALFGGTLTAGPCDGQGFEVRASLPYGELGP